MWVLGYVLSVETHPPYSLLIFSKVCSKWLSVTIYIVTCMVYIDHSTIGRPSSSCMNFDPSSPWLSERKFCWSGRCYSQIVEISWWPLRSERVPSEGWYLVWVNFFSYPNHWMVDSKNWRQNLWSPRFSFLSHGHMYTCIHDFHPYFNGNQWAFNQSWGTISCVFDHGRRYSMSWQNETVWHSSVPARQ